jgi:dienelactone hydrolase
MPSAQGVGEKVRSTARALARAGFVALAADMYGGGVHLADPAEIAAAVTPLNRDPELLRARVAAWLGWLVERPEVDRGRVGAIGYCFGGVAFWSWRAAGPMFGPSSVSTDS